MPVLEKSLTKSQLKEMHKREQHLTEMAKQDSAFASQLAASGQQSFQYQKKKSVARNYRDYEIYSRMHMRETDAFGDFQPVIDGLNQQLSDVSADSDALFLPEGYMPCEKSSRLRTADALKRLAGSSLTQEVSTEEELSMIQSSLFAGIQKRKAGEEVPDKLREKEREGLTKLQSLYFRHLEALDEKYGGADLAKMTPVDYLRNLPGIEQDFACLQDMKVFIMNYKPVNIDDAAQALLMKKLTYYLGAWDLLQERAQLYAKADDESVVTQSGKLQKNVEKSWSERMRSLREGAKRAGAFADLKKTKKKAAKTANSGNVSFEEAMKTEASPDAFEPGSEPDAVKMLADIAAIKKIRELKEKQPDYYRLGIGYADYLRSEKLIELLPAYEKAVELHLRKQAVEGRDDDVAISVRAAADAAFAEYKAKAQEVKTYSQDEITELLQKDFATLRYEHDARSESIMADESLRSEIVTQENLTDVCQIMGDSFVCMTDEVQKKKDLEDVCRLVKNSTSGFSDELSDEIFNAFTRKSRAFSAQYSQLYSKLQEDGFSDEVLVENRCELEKMRDMATFLTMVGGSGLAEKCRQRAETDDSMGQEQLMFSELEKNMETATMLSRYAQGLAVQHAMANGINSIFLKAGSLTYARLEGTDLKDRIQSEKEENQKELDALRATHIEAAHKAELDEIMFKAKVSAAVGKELEAAARKHQFAPFESFIGWLGNRAGAVCQLLSWAMHTKRTADHGEMRYNEVAEKQDKLLEEIPEMKQSVLPDYQRGAEDFAPKVELGKLYESPMKTEIRQMVEDAAQLLERANIEDLHEDVLGQAIEAMQRYSTVVGIVNSDTTEMEMAFLDRFRIASEKYLEANSESTNPQIIDRCALLIRLQHKLGDNLGGTLRKTMSEEEFQLIVDSTTAYVEDTTFSENMEESNVLNMPIFLHEPNINDVRQSSIGDCWLLSSLSTVVKTSPEFVRSMFEDLGNGDVLVRLYDWKNKLGASSDDFANSTPTPVYFKLRKHYETGWGNASDTIWVQLLEKAYALSGFNHRNEMKLESDHLFNVADELTAGEIDKGIAHLTGKRPEYIPSYTRVTEQTMLSDEMKACLFSGFSDDMISSLDICFDEHFSQYTEEQDLRRTQIEEFFSAILMHRQTLLHHYLNLPDDQFRAFMSSDAAVQDKVMEIVDKVKENLEAVRRGEVPQRFQSTYATLHGIAANKAPESPDIETLRMSQKMKLKGRTDGYHIHMECCYRKIEEAIEAGGAVSISIPHCVNIIDCMEKDGKLFVLMRDPFNVYNTEYVHGKSGQIEAKKEGLGKVFTGHKENRSLIGGREELLRAGFRGTSWIEFSEIYPHLGDTEALKKSDLTPSAS
ncbi:MAG: hypothetical protein K6F52_04720 [Clostridia bacterium]|nr:hypothetical protein [Clostridia bacterium]